MADNTATGRQLFFDLIAASAEPRPQSSFEAAAWAVAAEHAASREAPTPAEWPSHDLEPMDQADQAEVDPLAELADPEDEEAVSGPVALRVVDDGDEPPLHRFADSAPSTVTLPPGPRVSAFAAATGASLSPTSQRPEPLVPLPDHAECRPDGEDAPDGDFDAPVSVLAESSTSVAGLPTWVRAPLIATHPSAALDLAEQVRIAHPTTTDQDQVAPADRPPEPDPVELSPEPAVRQEADAAYASADRYPPDPRLALLDDDDDFGPLILPEPTRRGWRRKGRSDSAGTLETPAAGIRRRRLWTTGLVAAAVALLACSAVWWLRPAPTSPPALQPPDVAMVDWRGIALPTSENDGPTELTDTRAKGFAPTALGAAIAAAQLSVRTDPAAGPEVFEPVLADQVVGNEQRLADAVRAQFDAGLNEGAPGTLLGWRVDGDPAAGSVTAHLAVQHADGTRADYAIPLAWVDGDWRIDVPDSGPFFPVTDLSGEYAPFVEEATS